MEPDCNQPDNYPDNYRDVSAGITRRRTIGAALSALGIAALGVPVSAEAFKPRQDGRFLSKNQLDTLEDFVGTLIPDTDTPGAITAGVHHFIDMLLDEWASEATRAPYVSALALLDSSAKQAHKRTFAELTPEQQYALVDDIDALAFGDGEKLKNYRALKRMTLMGYYTSEIGASVELQFNPLPGGYPGCVTMADIGRAWYKH